MKIEARQMQGSTVAKSEMSVTVKFLESSRFPFGVQIRIDRSFDD